MDEKNCRKLFIEAKRLDGIELKDKAMKVLAHNFMLVSKTHALSSLDLGLMKEVLFK